MVMQNMGGRFLFNIILARRHNVSNQAQTRIPLLGSMIEQPMMSMVTTEVLLRREEASQAAVATTTTTTGTTGTPAGTTTPTGTAPGTPAGTTGTGPGTTTGGPAGGTGTTPPPPVSKQVPLVLTMTGAHAKAAVSRAGLVAIESTIEQTSLPVVQIGHVMDQNPAAGSIVPDGSQVQVYTSLGVRVPSVAGLKYDDAVDALGPMWHVLREEPKRRSTRDPDTVISQDPDPNDLTDVVDADGYLLITLYTVPAAITILAV